MMACKSDLDAFPGDIAQTCRAEPAISPRFAKSHAGMTAAGRGFLRKPLVGFKNRSIGGRTILSFTEGIENTWLPNQTA
ncbi:MAG: hypothetical protein KatS3mg113_0170 [Planctomycetaceae bacterium]|nr:MAG: hypothetical protein KatS3mg113_0170 [Planctomycetaceae bacterium]